MKKKIATIFAIIKEMVMNSTQSVNIIPELSALCQMHRGERQKNINKILWKNS